MQRTQIYPRYVRYMSIAIKITCRSCATRNVTQSLRTSRLMILGLEPDDDRRQERANPIVTAARTGSHNGTRFSATSPPTPLDPARARTEESAVTFGVIIKFSR